MSDFVPTTRVNEPTVSQVVRGARPAGPARQAVSGLVCDAQFSLPHAALVTCSTIEPPEPGDRPHTRVVDANDPASVLADAVPGMCAISADGVKLGHVAEVRIDARARKASIVVEYGRLGKRLKRVDGDLVDLVDGNRVFLSIGQRTFRALLDQPS